MSRKPKPGSGDGEDEDLRRLVFAGLILVLALVVGFVGWTLFAKLDSAVIANGVIAADSRRKTVQHKEGGILRRLLVAEGQEVRAGQPLAQLDTTQADTSIGQLDGQLVAVRARIARLRAETSGAKVLELPPELVARRDEPVVAEAIAAQEQLFESRRRALESKSAMTERRILQLKEQIKAAEVQQEANAQQLTLTEEEAKSVGFLYRRGYETRPKLLELQRSIADKRGRDGELKGTIAQAQQQIAEAEMELRNLTDSAIADDAKDLEDARAQEVDLSERLRAAQDVRDRLTIVSPQDGVVVDMRFVTPGAVVGPGQALMDIVPADDDLIVDAKVQPNDIDVVHVGLPAQVKLTAYKSSLSPYLEGRVIFVSADQMLDEHNGAAYFDTRVRLKKSSLAKWKRIIPVPGMPAEVLIVTGEERVIDYFWTPLRDRMRRAFREG
jgi:HlyD family secretion protein